MSTEELELLSMGELASLWHVSTKTIRRLVNAGEIPTVRFGRSVRIRADVARAIVEGQCPPADTMAGVHYLDRRRTP